MVLMSRGNNGVIAGAIMVLLPSDYDKYLFTFYGHCHVFISYNFNLTMGVHFRCIFHLN